MTLQLPRHHLDVPDLPITPTRKQRAVQQKTVCGETPIGPQKIVEDRSSAGKKLLFPVPHPAIKAHTLKNKTKKGRLTQPALPAQ